MKTKEENYESPSCKTIEIEAEQIICGSGDGETATHEGFEEEEYEWEVYFIQKIKDRNLDKNDKQY